MALVVVGCPLTAPAAIEYYRKDMEGLYVNRLRVAKVLTKLGHDVDLVLAFQQIHDKCETEEWTQQIWWLANEWDLSPAVLPSKDRLFLAPWPKHTPDLLALPPVFATKPEGAASARQTA